MQQMKYILGLDLGITSIGWAVVGVDNNNSPTHIIDTNVSILESLEDKDGNLSNAARRGARGARRRLRRRAYRVKRVKELLHQELGLEIGGFYNVKGNTHTNPYALKVKGLVEKLSVTELAIVLVHYAKHRGYRSNRKNDKTNEDSKLLDAISQNEKILKDRGFTYSQYIYEFALERRGVNFPKLKNSDENYQYLFNRRTIKEEIELLLTTQVQVGVITQEFKDSYIEIWSSQRDFSEGPGEGSSYIVDFASTFGYCGFEVDGERHLRAPKCAPSTEFFTLLQKLTNLRYRDTNNAVQRLTSDQIQDIFAFAKTKKELSYSDIDKRLGINAHYEGLSLSKDEYIKVLIKYKKDNNIDKEERIEVREDESFKQALGKALKSKKLGNLKNFYGLKKIFNDHGYAQLFQELPIEYLDDIVTCLTFYKTDTRISQYFSGEGDLSVTELDWSLYPKVISEIVPNISSNYSDSASLSLILIRKLNKKLQEGIEYSEAMNQLGYDHARVAVSAEKKKLLPPIRTILDAFPNEITNPRVIRVLSYTMKTVNAIIKKYGEPQDINIEVARDIANGLRKRRDIEQEMLKNYEQNERSKTMLLRDFPNLFRSFKDIRKTDLERIKLYEEQRGICMYSLKAIPYDTLFSKDLQVDHIVPYSLSFNDSFHNKTLVYTKTNQEKGNRLPIAYIKNNSEISWSQFSASVESNYKLSDTKKRFYLATEVVEEWKSRSLNDTRFITKYITKIFENFLDFDGKVNCYNGQVINMLKKSYGLTRVAHSLESTNYRQGNINVLEEYKVLQNSDEVELHFIFKNKTTQALDTIKIKKAKENDNTPRFILADNRALDVVVNNTEYLNQLMTNHPYRMTSFELVEKVIDMAWPETIKESFLTIFNKLHIEFTKKEMRKNRDNHFHHALDAVLTACMTKSLLVRITKFYQQLEHFQDEVHASIKSGKPYIIEDTGELITSYEDFESFKRDIIRNQFELPYGNFEKEVTYRIYEVNAEVQKQKFDTEFNDNLYRNIRPLFPVKFSQKRETGPLHKETIYGISNDKKVLTQRISVDSIKDTKKIEKILYKDTRAKDTYNAVKAWFQLNKKQRGPYPTLPNGREIKKITIDAGDANKAVFVNRGYAAVDTVLRTDIYKSKNCNDTKYYFVQRHAFNLAQERNGENFNVTLWWGQGANHKTVSFQSIQESYECVDTFNKYDLVFIETKSGSGYGYLNGFSSGMLEISSIFGDGYDLFCGEQTLFNKYQSRFQITTSTIKKIEKLHVNLLGEIYPGC